MPILPTLFPYFPLPAAGGAPPDELTLNVGDLEIDGKKDGKDKILAQGFLFLLLTE